MARLLSTNLSLCREQRLGVATAADFIAGIVRLIVRH
jgi:hypothetical protein